MARLSSVAAGIVAAVCLVIAAGAGADPAPSADRPLRTGVLPATVATAPAAQTLMSRIGELGTSVVVLDFWWRQIVKPGADTASDFNPRDPDSPYYDWGTYDAHVQAAHANGLDVLGVILDQPDWASEPPPDGSPGAILPDPQALADFGVAAAKRYDGVNHPRVFAWEVWNEPNISLYIKPQFVNGQPFSPGWYRTMLNTYYDAVKAAVPGVLIVGGGTAPYFDNSPEVTSIDPAWGPLSFMRHLFCLSESLQPTCSASVKLDAWAHHPYTEGSPSRRASLTNSVSLADMPKLRALLQAAQDAGHVVSSQPLELWAPEFSWDSNPPDPLGVPEATLLRWVPQSLHDMWQYGVSLVGWFTLYDQAAPDPYPVSYTHLTLPTKA